MKIMSDQEILDVIGECAANSVPVVMLYSSKDGQKARVVRVDKVDVNKEGGWYLSGEDSLSGQYRSFQVANIDQIHPLSFGPLINVTVSMSEPGVSTLPSEGEAYQWPTTGGTNFNAPPAIRPPYSSVDLEDRYGGH